MVNKKHHPIRAILVPVVIVLAGLSAYQYYDQREITWHRDPLATFGDALLRIRSFLRNDEIAPFVIDLSQPAERSHSASGDNTPAIDPRFSDPGEPRFELVGRVTRIIDGDSFEVTVSGNDFPIRMFGLDTPEHDQPHGREATQALTRKLDRRTVQINIVDIDNYGRLVGTVYQEGENINLTMITEGHGWWYRQYAGSERELGEAEQAARKAGLGLWSEADPVAPWDWRRAN